jgi:putative salt-induced outer membrane protein YdiY
METEKPPVPVADVVLANGNSLTGELVFAYKGKVKLKHKMLGEVEFKWQDLTAITTDQEIRLSLKDGDRLTGRLVEAKEGHFKLLGPELRTGEISLSEVAGINEPERDVTWKGDVLLSYVRTAGNKRTADAAFLFRGGRKTEVDSISLKGAYDYGTAEDELSKRSSSGVLKYNYRLSRVFYTYLAAGAAMDYFKGLELRTDIGGGGGWHVLDRKNIELRLELGPSYSNEDYAVPVAPEPDRDVRYGAWRSAIECEVSLNKMLTFYQLVEFVTPFDHAGLWRFHSESVLSVNLSNSLSIKAGYILDHDRRAAAGTKRTDGKTLIGIGYKF